MDSVLLTLLTLVLSIESTTRSVTVKNLNYVNWYPHSLVSQPFVGNNPAYWRPTPSPVIPTLVRPTKTRSHNNFKNKIVTSQLKPSPFLSNGKGNFNIQTTNQNTTYHDSPTTSHINKQGNNQGIVKWNEGSRNSGVSNLTKKPATVNNQESSNRRYVKNIAESNEANTPTINNGIGDGIQQLRERSPPPKVQYKFPGHWATPSPESGIDLGFTPVQTYLQVRKTNEVKHVPQSEAFADASSEEELLNANRLKEVIRMKKIQEVYSEEGYEDSAYDHAGHERNAEHSEDYEKEDGGKFRIPQKIVQQQYDSNTEESKHSPKYRDFETELNETVSKEPRGIHLVERDKNLTVKKIMKYDGVNQGSEDVLNTTSDNHPTSTITFFTQERPFPKSTKLIPLSKHVSPFDFQDEEDLSFFTQKRSSIFETRHKSQPVPQVKVYSGQAPVGNGWSLYSYFEPEISQSSENNNELHSFSWRDDFEPKQTLESVTITDKKYDPTNGTNENIGLIAKVNKAKERLVHNMLEAKQFQKSNSTAVPSTGLKMKHYTSSSAKPKTQEEEHEDRKFQGGLLLELQSRNKISRNRTPSSNHKRDQNIKTYDVTELTPEKQDLETPTVVHYVNSLTNAHYAPKIKGRPASNKDVRYYGVRNPYNLDEALQQLRHSQNRRQKTMEIEPENYSGVLRFEPERIKKMKTRKRRSFDVENHISQPSKQISHIDNKTNHNESETQTEVFFRQLNGGGKIINSGKKPFQFGLTRFNQTSPEETYHKKNKILLDNTMKRPRRYLNEGEEEFDEEKDDEGESDEEDTVDEVYFEDRNKAIEDEERERLMQEAIEKAKYENELSKEISNQEKNILQNTFSVLGFNPELSNPFDSSRGFVEQGYRKDTLEPPPVSWSNKNRFIDTEKYPFYFSESIHEDSPLRFALNPRDIPRKSGSGMEFYESRERKYPCPEVEIDFSDLPKMGSGNKRSGENPRINGLGDKIQCLKMRYFGEDPLDNPFFKDRSINFDPIPKQPWALNSFTSPFFQDVLPEKKIDENRIARQSTQDKLNYDARTLPVRPARSQNDNIIKHHPESIKINQNLNHGKQIKTEKESNILESRKMYHSKYKYHPNRTIEMLVENHRPEQINLTNIDQHSANREQYTANFPIKSVKLSIGDMQSSNEYKKNRHSHNWNKIHSNHRSFPEPTWSPVWRNSQQNRFSYRRPKMKDLKTTETMISPQKLSGSSQKTLKPLPNSDVMNRNRIILVPVDCEKRKAVSSGILSTIITTYCKNLVKRNEQERPEEVNLLNFAHTKLVSSDKERPNHLKWSTPTIWSNSSDDWSPIVRHSRTTVKHVTEEIDVSPSKQLNEHPFTIEKEAKEKNEMITIPTVTENNHDETTEYVGEFFKDRTGKENISFEDIVRIKRDTMEAIRNERFLPFKRKKLLKGVKSVSEKHDKVTTTEKPRSNVENHNVTNTPENFQTGKDSKKNDGLVPKIKPTKHVPRAIIERKNLNIHKSEKQQNITLNDSPNIQIEVSIDKIRTAPTNSGLKYPPRIKYYEKLTSKSSPSAKNESQGKPQETTVELVTVVNKAPVLTHESSLMKHFNTKDVKRNHFEEMFRDLGIDAPNERLDSLRQNQSNLTKNEKTNKASAPSLKLNVKPFRNILNENGKPKKSSKGKKDNSSSDSRPDLTDDVKDYITTEISKLKKGKSENVGEAPSAKKIWILMRSKNLEPTEESDECDPTSSSKCGKIKIDSAEEPYPEDTFQPAITRIIINPRTEPSIKKIRDDSEDLLTEDTFFRQEKSIGNKEYLKSYSDLYDVEKMPMLLYFVNEKTGIGKWEVNTESAPSKKTFLDMSINQKPVEIHPPKTVPETKEDFSISEKEKSVNNRCSDEGQEMTTKTTEKERVEYYDDSKSENSNEDTNKSGIKYQDVNRNEQKERIRNAFIKKRLREVVKVKKPSRTDDELHLDLK